MFTVYIGTDVYNEVVKVEFESVPYYMGHWTELRMVDVYGTVISCDVQDAGDLIIETNHTNELPGEEQVADDKPMV